MSRNNSARMDFILLYACDVREHPEAYDARVRAAPEAAAFELTEGLSESDCARLLNDLRAERRQVARAAGS